MDEEGETSAILSLEATCEHVSGPGATSCAAALLHAVLQGLLTLLSVSLHAGPASSSREKSEEGYY